MGGAPMQATSGAGLGCAGRGRMTSVAVTTVITGLNRNNGNGGPCLVQRRYNENVTLGRSVTIFGENVASESTRVPRAH